MIQSFEKVDRLKGELELPGDKSISHRAVMFSAMASGTSEIYNYLKSDDIYSSINCFRQLGCEIMEEKDRLIVHGAGYKGFDIPTNQLDSGNSGTTARLIAGILAAQEFKSTLVGDSSLSKRPMKRIVDPLKEMGAEFELNEKVTLPLTILPSKKLHSITYTLPVASAQVKSAVLLCGLHLSEPTTIIEPVQTRNHTENMLDLPVQITEAGKLITASRAHYPEPKKYVVPSDISSAAFFIILTLLSDNSEIMIKNVLLNETRTGIIKVLKSMNAEIEIVSEKNMIGEIFGDVVVRSSKLINTKVPEDLIANIIDEIPVLSAAGLLADGEFNIRHAKELRVKESDRIAALCSNYKLLGVDVKEFEDGFTLNGTIRNDNTLLESFGDHRIAMAFAVLGLLTSKKIRIKNFECVSVSNPAFLQQVNSLLI